MATIRNKTCGTLLKGVVSALLLANIATAQVAEGRLPVPKTIRQILVSIPDHKLAVIDQGRVIRTFPVSVGAAVSPSPTGEFRIVNRIANPTYYHPGIVIPAGTDNPIGPRWIGLNQKGYGIHGTNQPSSIGRAASHGCIRLRNHDIERLFAMVHVGDVVLIRGDRDQQTAAIFGGTADAGTAVVAEEQAGTVNSIGAGQ